MSTGDREITATYEHEQLKHSQLEGIQTAGYTHSVAYNLNTSLIVARVKFEPESSSSHESSSSQFFFHIFFPIISFDYTVNIIVKKMSDS